MLPLLFFTAPLFAQDRQVTGRVTDTAGSPVANASVVVKGGRNGAQTGTDGTFSIRVPSSASTLVITSVGFARRETPIGNGTVKCRFGTF